MHADLLVEQLEASRGEGRGVIARTVIPLPQAVVRGRLDRTQNEIGDHGCSLWGASSPSSRNFAAPDEDVQFPENRLLGRVGEPGDADRAVRCLKHASARCAMLLDGTLHCPNTLDHAFGRQLVEELSDGTLNGVFRLCAR